MGSNLTHTVGGDIASFKCADTMPIESLKVNFLPIQEGSGDPSPSNVRAISGWNNINSYIKEENLFKNTTTISGYKNNDGIITASQNSYYTSDIFDIDMNNLDMYKLKYESTGDFAFRLYFFDDQDQWISRSNLVVYTLSSSPYFATIYNFTTFPQNCKKIQFQFNTVVDFSKVQFLKAKTISIAFPPVGKNKLDINAPESDDPLELNHRCIGRFFRPDKQYWIDGSSYLSNISIQDNSFSYTTGAANAYGISYCLYLIPEKIYTVSGITSNGKANIFFFNNNKEMISYQNISLSGTNFTVPINTYYTFIIFKPSSKNVTASFSNLQLEEGSSATIYEAPNNMIYGGYIDLAKGELVAKQFKLVINDGSNFIYKDYTTYSRFQIKMSELGVAFPGNVGIIFNYLKFGTSDEWCGFIDVSAGSENAKLRIYTPSSINSVELFSQYISEHPIEIIYGTQPMVYPFSKSQLQTLLGQNHIWSNTNSTTEVTYQFQDHLSKQRISMRQPHLETASGAIASFDTDMRAKLSQCKIEFAPIQEGSGDPSPENVRNITGWTGIDIIKASKNIINLSQWQIDNDIANKFIISNNIITLSQYSYLERYNKYYIISGYSYKFSAHVKTISLNNDSTSFALMVYNSASQLLNSAQIKLMSVGYEQDVYWTIPSNTSYISFGSWGYTGVVEISNIQLEYNNNVTSYEPYNGITIPLDWSSTAGTLYGGYVDLISGKLVQTHKKYTFTGDDLILFNQFHNANYGTITLPEECKKIFTPLASYFITLAPGAIIGQNQWYGRYNSDLSFFVFRLGNEINTEALAITYLDEHPLELCCQLVTPIEYQLTPTQLKSLIGINNIWSNANGNVEVKYYKH